MFDVGLGELLILAVVGLLVFGPERLPRAAADAARMIRNVRAMATNARKDLSDSAGVDLSDARDALREIQQLHPRRMVADMFTDDPTAGGVTDSRADSRADAGAASEAPTSEAPTSEASTSKVKREAPRYDPDAT